MICWFFISWWMIQPIPLQNHQDVPTFSEELCFISLETGDHQWWWYRQQSLWLGERRNATPPVVFHFPLESQKTGSQIYQGNHYTRIWGLTAWLWPSSWIWSSHSSVIFWPLWSWQILNLRLCFFIYKVGSDDSIYLTGLLTWFQETLHTKSFMLSNDAMGMFANIKQGYHFAYKS